MSASAPPEPSIPPDSDDLRSAPALHPALEPLRPLVGTWRGVGRGGYPTIDDFDYGQQVRFSHDGRAFLAYESRSWLLDADGNVLRPSGREVGWWRPGATPEEFEVLLAHPTGLTEVYLGQVRSPTQWELSTDVVARTATAKEVAANHRLYGIVEGELMYAVDMAAVGQPLTPHLSARLARIGG
jgi:THAP4-like, heme-binding beta-barrel domain